MKEQLAIGTVFSGSGAFEQAMLRLNINHKIVFACDNDKYVKQSYLSNYQLDEKNFYEDVKYLNARKYRYKLDILAGGSPCQSFSIAGKRAGLDDVRGTLFYDYARIVNESRPKVFIYENVKGLLSHDSGNTWRVVQEVFDSLGYSLHHKVLNSRDFGIPQNRERIFILGFRKKNYKFVFPVGFQLKVTASNFLDRVIDSKYFLSDKGVAFVKDPFRLRKKYTQINGEVILCQKANQQSNLHGDFIDHGKSINLNKQFVKIHKRQKPTIYKEALKYAKLEGYIYKHLQGKNTIVKHDMSKPYVKHNMVRKLTPRECFRLMGYMESYKIVVSDQQAYKQAGNSIVVDVLIAILKNIDLESI